MSLNAFAIMLKPFLAKYLEPLEEDGTIAKLQADIALVAKENAIPELAKLVANLERYNDLMERVLIVLKKEESENVLYREMPPRIVKAYTDPDATGLDRNTRDGVSELPRAD